MTTQTATLSRDTLQPRQLQCHMFHELALPAHQIAIDRDLILHVVIWVKGLCVDISKERCSRSSSSVFWNAGMCIRLAIPLGMWSGRFVSRQVSRVAPDNIHPLT